MSARLTLLATTTCCAGLLALTSPGTAVAQAPSRDSTAATVKDLPLTAEQRQAFVGRYVVTLPQGLQVHVRVYDENGALPMRPEEQDQTQAPRLLHQGGNVFFAEGVPGLFALEFVMESDRATRFTLRKEDGVGRGVRVP